MKSALGIALSLLIMAAAAAESNIPAPSRAPKSWDLKFTFSDPERFSLVLPGDEMPTTYWYVRYKVENDTGKDIQFFPSAELVTDSLSVVEAGDQISPTVYDALVKKHKITDPFMIEPRRALGTLLQGEDNSKTSLFVFRQFDSSDNEFTIYFSGLSGEIQRIPNPNFDPKQEDTEENPRVFTLRKTLAVGYSLPGDRETRAYAEPIRLNRDWVMR